jgi:hypothetical protein
MAAQLGWHMPPSLDTWRQVQARTGLLQLQLPPVWQATPVRREVCCLQLQPPSGSSCSRHSDTRLAAVGYANGMLHIIKLADILEAAAAAESAAATAAAATGSFDDPGGAAAPNAAVAGAPPPPPPPPAAAAAAAAIVPRTAELPAGCVWSVDLQDRLVSCCWAAGDLPELATAGPGGVKIRRFVEVRPAQPCTCRQELQQATGKRAVAEAWQLC